MRIKIFHDIVNAFGNVSNKKEKINLLFLYCCFNSSSTRWHRWAISKYCASSYKFILSVLGGIKKSSSLDDQQIICCCDSPNLSSAFRMLTTVMSAGARLDETDGVQVEAAAGFSSTTLMVLKHKKYPETRLSNEELQVWHLTVF